MNKQRSRWRVLLVVGIGTALSLIGDAALYTVLPTHTAEAGVTLAVVGILLSANRWVRLAANGAAGWISDRWPRRWVFVPAMFVGAVSTAVYALRPGFALFLVGRLLWGMAWSGIWVAGNAIIFDISSDGNRGRWVGYYHVSFFLGASSGAFLGGGSAAVFLGVLFTVGDLGSAIGPPLAYGLLPLWGTQGVYWLCVLLLLVMLLTAVLQSGKRPFVSLQPH